MLQLEHVKKSYDKKEVLTDVTYTFEEGKVYSLLGGAGAPHCLSVYAVICL